MSATVKSPDQSRSKIGRLAFADRMTFNRMVRDGYKGRVLTDWLAQHGVGGVSAENLRKYRLSPAYRAWLAEEAQVDQDREAAEQAMRLAESLGGSASDKLKAILAGKLYPLLASMGQETDIAPLVQAMRAVTEAEKLELQRRTADQRDEELALNERKFRLRFAEEFMTWYEDKRAREIADGRGNANEKIQALLALMDAKERGG